ASHGSMQSWPASRRSGPICWSPWATSTTPGDWHSSAYPNPLSHAHSHPPGRGGTEIGAPLPGGGSAWGRGDGGEGPGEASSATHRVGRGGGGIPTTGSSARRPCPESAGRPD